LPKTLHQPLSRQIRQAVRSAIASPVRAGFVEGAVAELGIVEVSVEQGVGPVRLG
jgi:hypothetical protein